MVHHDPQPAPVRCLSRAAQLVPQGAKEPLGIDNFAISDDARKLLFFTNTRKVWRLHTRGDYWVFDRDRQTLHKLGGKAPEATLMFAAFDPGGTTGRVRSREQPVRRETRRRHRRGADQGRLANPHQRHVRLGLRGRAFPPRRIPLEPRRPEHCLLADRQLGRSRISHARHGRRALSQDNPGAISPRGPEEFGLSGWRGSRRRRSDAVGRNSGRSARELPRRMEWVPEPETGRPAAQPPPEQAAFARR